MCNVMDHLATEIVGAEMSVRNIIIFTIKGPEMFVGTWVVREQH